MKNAGVGAASNETTAMEVNDEGQLGGCGVVFEGLAWEEDSDPDVLLCVDGDVLGEERTRVGGVLIRVR